jgi:hypothetical protein
VSRTDALLLVASKALPGSQEGPADQPIQNQPKPMSIRATQAYLERDHFHKGSKRVRSCRADVVIWITHPSQNRNHEEDNIGQGFMIQPLNDICQVRHH